MPLQEINRRHTESMDDIIGMTPGWLLHSGIGMVFFVTAVILVGSSFFKYPDKITCAGTLTSDQPHIEIISPSNGYIDSFVNRNGANILKGDTLLFIHNTTKVAQLDILRNWIKKYESISNPQEFLELEFESGLQVGVLQNSYARLELQYKEFIMTLNNGIVFRQINQIEKEIQKIYKLNESLNVERDIYEQELDLTIKNYQRQIQLHEEGIVSEMELEKFQIAKLQMERQYESMEKNILENDVKIQDLHLQILEIKQIRADKIQDFQVTISETISNLSTQFEDWTNAYVVTSPTEGTLYYSFGLEEKFNLKQGQPIAFVQPFEKNGIYVSGLSAMHNSGKLEVGQKAILKFDAYPHKEFGVVESSISTISTLPEEDQEGNKNYELIFQLDSIIITSYQDTIPFKPELTARIEIITEDKTLYSRIFNQFLKMIDFKA